MQHNAWQDILCFLYQSKETTTAKSYRRHQSFADFTQQNISAAPEKWKDVVKSRQASPEILGLKLMTILKNTRLVYTKKNVLRTQNT